MTYNERRELVVIVFEFVLTLVVIVGGGFMISKGIAPEFMIGIITTVVMFWFSDKIPNKKTPPRTEITTPAVKVDSTPTGTTVTTIAEETNEPPIR